jgi:hypothetical protein
MTQNIEQRTEVAVKKYESASDVAEQLMKTDSVVETPAGLRKSIPKISRETDEEFNAQRKQHENSFQSRWALSQQAVPWAANTLVSDSLQRYSVGTVGQDDYKEYLPVPDKLPFTTGATIAEDLAASYWLENGVPSKNWTESYVADIAGKPWQVGEEAIPYQVYIWRNGKLPLRVYTVKTGVIMGDEPDENFRRSVEKHASEYGAVDDYYLFNVTSVAEAVATAYGYTLESIVNPNPTDNWEAIQLAVNELKPGEVLSFDRMHRGCGVTKQVVALGERITVKGDNKDGCRILPLPGFTGTSLFKFGDGSQAYQKTYGMGYVAAINSAGNDVSGLEAHNHYNFEAFDIRAQGGNYITRETAGIDLLDGRHTRIHKNQLHNSFCYGMIIRRHLTGLNIFDNAFDESDTAIISKGNIVEMQSYGNEFGSSRSNPVHPAPFGGVNIDLREGTHGRIRINDTFTGGGGTQYHVRWDYIEHFEANGSFMSARRFSLAGNGATGRSLIIRGIFGGNGGDSTTDDYTQGTDNPDTSPFCTDIHLKKAFAYSTVLSGVVSDQKNKPLAWIEGDVSALHTSNVSIVNASCLFDVIAYVHKTAIKKTQILQNGTIFNPVTGVLESVISARTVTRGVPQYGNISFPGAKTGDLVCINFKATPHDYNLGLHGHVLSSGLLRFWLVNTSDTPVAIPDTEIITSLIKSI